MCIALSRFIDHKLSSYDFQDGNFKKLSDRRLQKISNHVKRQINWDTAAYQVIQAPRIQVILHCTHFLSVRTGSIGRPHPSAPRSLPNRRKNPGNRNGFADKEYYQSGKRTYQLGLRHAITPWPASQSAAFTNVATPWKSPA